MGQQYAGINNKYGKKGHLYDLSAKLLSQTKVVLWSFVWKIQTSFIFFIA